jgi:Eukaryotic glutathione synthase
MLTNVCGKEAVILFVVEDVTFNIADQKAQELEIRRQAPLARVIRRSMVEIAKCGRLEQDKRLIVDNMEVAVVYWRCGQLF